MLILTRKAGESIVIGDDIVITIVEAGRDQVRIGIDREPVGDGPRPRTTCECSAGSPSVIPSPGHSR